jgi:hypothetical protein
VKKSTLFNEAIDRTGRNLDHQTISSFSPIAYSSLSSFAFLLFSFPSSFSCSSVFSSSGSLSHISCSFSLSSCQVISDSLFFFSSFGVLSLINI